MALNQEKVLALPNHTHCHAPQQIIIAWKKAGEISQIYRVKKHLGELSSSNFAKI